MILDPSSRAIADSMIKAANNDGVIRWQALQEGISSIS